MQDKKLTALIADDEPLMRDMLGSYLKTECHFDVLMSRDGEQALTLFQKHSEDIDITFLDIEMPKLDGLEVLREIRKINPLAYVVILSGAGNFKNVTAAAAAGMDGFIVKPYSNNKIDEALKNYSDHEAFK